jgi:uncharacterized membrane protein
VKSKIRIALRWLLAIAMVGIGVLHFVDAQAFVAIMPPWIPWHLAMVYISGFFEIAGGVGLLIPQTRRAAGWGLIALYIAVFPANLHMAINDVPLNGEHLPPAMLWGRLPFQLVFIALAYWVSRPNEENPRSNEPT